MIASILHDQPFSRLPACIILACMANHSPLGIAECGPFLNEAEAVAFSFQIFTISIAP